MEGFALQRVSLDERCMMSASRTIELPIRGMDCDECTRHVQQALTAVPGVTFGNPPQAAALEGVR